MNYKSQNGFIDSMKVISKVMTYKEKFEESENRAHYKNIATKILREMTLLRSLVENSPIAPRRWIWELIQNAKDVHQNDGVKIIIDYYKNSESSYISFKHNGKPFTADNIRFLIEQISSKDRDKDTDGKPKTTGKFGTGFLTTHLLSEKVLVKGIAKEPELDYRKFEFELDRSGFQLEDITDSVQISKDSVQDLDDRPVFEEYEEGTFNTSFNYYLTDKIGHSVAQKGLTDLEKCLPYTFVFVDELKKVRVKHSGLLFKNTTEFTEIAPNIKAVGIRIKQGSEQNSWKTLTFAILNKNLTTIAIPVKIESEKVEILPIDESVPKLFCDFPLIGTEIFSFPAIINNPNFNPTDPRDGVYLTISQRENPLAEDNKQYIQEAVDLYFELLKFASDNCWSNLHLLAQIKPINNCPSWINESWFKNNVLSPIRSKLLDISIVRTADENLQAIRNDNKIYIWFPSSTKLKYRNELWKLANYWFPYQLPKESDVELWNKLTWKDCGKLTSEQLAAFVENNGSLIELEKVLKDIEPTEWLVKFYDFMRIEDEYFDSIINKRAIFPNQHGNFIKKSKLYQDKGDIVDVFKDILFEFGNDIRDILLDEDVDFKIGEDSFLDNSYAIKEIISEVNSKAIDREIAKNYKPAFKKLLIWFQNKPGKAKELFPTLYKNKHLLYDDDEILDNIKKAEQLDDLLTELNIKDISEIKTIIEESKASSKTVIPVTEQILVNMGISSLEEWQEAIKDMNLAALYSHESTPTTDMFVYVQGLIKKAKNNVIDVLDSLAEYDIENIDTSTAPTILAGILKNGNEISIVVRPAYNDEVIIYYGSERDILDFEPSELWIDDDVDPRQITLGHILKSASIVKFPV